MVKGISLMKDEVHVEKKRNDIKNIVDEMDRHKKETSNKNLGSESIN
ncbi:MAG: hypothetical protein LBI98_01145 [Endomicrobium sp.]|jgi:hypothetical protein|nr:hypothetical protein [Endomicrobium sp.]